MLGWQLVGANPSATGEGAEQLPGHSNYLLGRDPQKWRTDVPQYARAVFRNIYPGVDVAYYGNQGQLEYDFILAPHADPRRIVLQFEGAERLEIDREGHLSITVNGRAIVQRKPFAHQTVNGLGRPVTVNYRLLDNYHVAFDVAPYDTSRPLVIDPVLFYSTYLGGNNADFGTSIVADQAGNAYLAGVTFSANFPTAGGVSNILRGNSDIFIAKLNPAGNSLLYSTYLGGDGNEEAAGVTLDTDGNLYLTASTDSAQFPVTAGAFRATPAGGRDAFVTKLNPTATPWFTALISAAQALTTGPPSRLT